jgi:hypothetical protein
MKFRENPFRGSRVFKFGQTDMAKMIGAFLQLSVENAPKLAAEFTDRCLYTRDTINIHFPRGEACSEDDY